MRTGYTSGIYIGDSERAINCTSAVEATSQGAACAAGRGAHLGLGVVNREHNSVLLCVRVAYHDARANAVRRGKTTEQRSMWCFACTSKRARSVKGKRGREIRVLAHCTRQGGPQTYRVDLCHQNVKLLSAAASVIGTCTN
ncbi:hypothetical protein ACJJTC_000526 [Scirpophaga incertulas]